MKTLVKLTIPVLLGVMLALPVGMQAQRPGGSSSHRGSVHSSAGTRTQPSRSQGTRPGGSTTRPGGSSSSSSGRPASSLNMSSSSLRPSGSHKLETARPVQATRPSTQGTRPGSTRPGNSGSHGNQGNQGGNLNRPGNDRPGHNKPGYDRPGNNRPGHNKPGYDRPGNNRPGHDKPGYDRPGNNRPGHGGFRPGHGGNSVHRPGGWASAARPHYNYRRPGYRPPRPGGGYWGAPLPNPYRINYWIPPVPRYVRVLPSVPTIGTVLGLTFGSFIDAGINALYNAGYSINGYYNNAIYLNNVLQFGYTWPEVVVQYDDGLMSGTQFYNWSAVPDQNMYYNLYNQMTARYGAPVETSFTNGGQTSTWWAGGNTGYITLSYGYGPSATGMSNYYTSLTYTAY